jgi:hypothetical protein
VLPKPRGLGPDAAQHVADPPLDVDPGALGRRSRPAIASPRADGPRQLVRQRVELGARVLGATEVVMRRRLRERFAQGLSSFAVRVLGPGVQDDPASPSSRSPTRSSTWNSRHGSRTRTSRYARPFVSLMRRILAPLSSRHISPSRSRMRGGALRGTVDERTRGERAKDAAAGTRASSRACARASTPRIPTSLARVRADSATARARAGSLLARTSAIARSVCAMYGRDRRRATRARARAKWASASARRPSRTARRPSVSARGPTDVTRPGPNCQGPLASSRATTS